MKRLDAHHGDRIHDLAGTVGGALAVVFVAGNTADFLLAEIQYWLFATLVSILAIRPWGAPVSSLSLVARWCAKPDLNDVCGSPCGARNRGAARSCRVLIFAARGTGSARAVEDPVLLAAPAQRAPRGLGRIPASDRWQPDSSSPADALRAERVDGLAEETLRFSPCPAAPRATLCVVSFRWRLGKRASANRPRRTA